MTHEKTFTLPTGRAVKVIAKTENAANTENLKPEVEVLIKDPKEDEFHVPIGVSHPKYWKLRKLDPNQSQILQIQYSGITEKQLRNAIKEFEKLRPSSHMN